MSEKFTPRQAGEQSAQNYNKHALAIVALDKVHETIEMSTRDAKDTELNERRRSLSEWHIEWWNERELPEAIKNLDATDQKALRDFQKNQEAYYQAALAEALLDGVEIRVCS